jgi:hypothetical protein
MGSLRHQIESICHIQLENNPVGVKVQGALYAMDYHFITVFSCNFELVQGEMCLQKHHIIEGIKHGL